MTVGGSITYGGVDYMAVAVRALRLGLRGRHAAAFFCRTVAREYGVRVTSLGLPDSELTIKGTPGDPEVRIAGYSFDKIEEKKGRYRW